MLRASLKTTRQVRERPADFGEFVAKFFKMDRDQSMLAAESAAKTISSTGLLTEDALKALIEAGIQTGAVSGTPNPSLAFDATLLREVLQENGRQ
jgi:hypothetical protein